MSASARGILGEGDVELVVADQGVGGGERVGHIVCAYVPWLSTSMTAVGRTFDRVSYNGTCGRCRRPGTLVFLGACSGTRAVDGMRTEMAFQLPRGIGRS